MVVLIGAVRVPHDEGTSMRHCVWSLGGAFACLFALAGTAVPATANVLIVIDKSTQQMTVAVDGVTRWQWPVSTGRSGYDTPSGSFQAFRMEAEHYSKEWDDAPMPHSIFFTKVGHAIHGYLDTRNIGSPASHGCVRLRPENAAKLYALVEQQGVLNTKVVLRGDTALARYNAPSRSYGAVASETLGSGGYPAPYREYGSPDRGYAGANREYRSNDTPYPAYAAPYAGSRDDRFAPMTVYQQP
jgi:hypothetical protein